MEVILWVTIGAGLLAVAFLTRHNRALKRATKEKEEAAHALPEHQVQCFSCGMIVTKEKALEKKGRYFCGVKRNDRNGNPVRRAESKRPEPGTGRDDP